MYEPRTKPFCVLLRPPPPRIDRLAGFAIHRRTPEVMKLFLEPPAAPRLDARMAFAQ